MKWLFGKKEKSVKHLEQDRKILISQQYLIESAISTAETAKEVTDYIQKQLHDSKAELSSTVKIIQDALIVCNEKNEIIGFNPSAEKMFDCSFSEIIGKNILKLFVSVNNKPIDEGSFWSILAKEQAWDTEFDGEPMQNILGKRVKGENFWIDLSVSELSLQEEKRFLFLVRDLNAEMRVRESDYNYKSIFENNKDSILILKNHKILKANNTACELFNLKQENLENSLFEHLIDFSDREKVFEIQENHLNGNISTIFYTFTINDKKTILFATELNIMYNNQNCILCTIRTLDEMNKINKFLELENEKFCYVSDKAPDLICVFDLELNVKYANPSFRNFYKVFDKNFNLKDYLPFVRRNDFTDFLKEMHNINRRQFSCRGGDRENIQDWCFYPIFENDKIKEYHGIGRDITHIIEQMSN